VAVSAWRRQIMASNYTNLTPGTQEYMTQLGALKAAPTADIIEFLRGAITP